MVSGTYRNLARTAHQSGSSRHICWRRERALALKLGRTIARGSRSTVHSWGNDGVAKVPVDGTPDSWIRSEAAFSTAAYEVGAPVPEFLGFDEHDGRVVSIFRRAVGVLMWDAVVAAPAQVGEHARRLVELQAALADLVPPVVLPSQDDRLSSKIRRAADRFDPTLAAVLDDIPAPQRVVLCHGDMHPGNVILTEDGPVVVDWFDASRGDPVCDVARTTILLSAQSGTAHLAGVHGELLERLHESYVEAAAQRFGFDVDALAQWRAVGAVARIAEGVPAHALADVWRSWRLTLSR